MGFRWEMPVLVLRFAHSTKQYNTIQHNIDYISDYWFESNRIAQETATYLSWPWTKTVQYSAVVNYNSLQRVIARTRPTLFPQESVGRMIGGCMDGMIPIISVQYYNSFVLCCPYRFAPYNFATFPAISEGTSTDRDASVFFFCSSSSSPLWLSQMLRISVDDTWLNSGSPSM